ncbi:hypothetical protein FB561_6124 [Kribbella amoyensis]|uniref:Uncharacterized protein n=1 Tax=Kribbella amoyensis TaxID=996641 RepID=A0A561B785_9ACTN|nr:hypothetical protein [Kribbella amoyensis]TWD74693.1 hypothetical protein FB561_6124 [Kribbella amoyensis]
MTDHPGEQVPPFDPDVEPGHEPDPEEQREAPDYDTEPDPRTFEYEDTEQSFAASLDDDVAPHEHVQRDEGLAPHEQFAPKPGPSAGVTPRPGPPIGSAPRPGPPSGFAPRLGPPGGVVPRPTPPAGVPAAAAPAEYARPVTDETAETAETHGGDDVRPTAPAVSHHGRADEALPADSRDRWTDDGDREAERDEEGHPLVEETMARLDGLRDKPVSEHAEVYGDLHERLQNALVEADAESGDRG